MKKFLVVLLILLIVIAAVGFLLPRSYNVAESVVIDVKPSKVHDLVGDLKRWDEWTPWKEEDPSIQVTFGPETKGVGASQSWTGKDGAGKLTFTASDPDQGVEFDLNFDGKPAKGAIRYERVGDGTKVTWSLQGDADVPVVGGYLALAMPRLAGPMFEKGLAKLKSQSEK